MSNRTAFVAMIGLSELGAGLINNSDEGYNVLVGSTANHPILFNSYATHPHVYNKQFNSTAAGLLQIIYPTWLGLCKNYGFTDFGKQTQVEMGIKLITERHAIDDVDNGNFAIAVQKCSAEWASLPGGDSGQHQNQLTLLAQYFTNAGGVINGASSI